MTLLRCYHQHVTLFLVSLQCARKLTPISLICVSSHVYRFMFTNLAHVRIASNEQNGMYTSGILLQWCTRISLVDISSSVKSVMMLNIPGYKQVHACAECRGHIVYAVMYILSVVLQFVRHLQHRFCFQVLSQEI